MFLCAITVRKRILKCQPCETFTKIIPKVRLLMDLPQIYFWTGRKLITSGI